MYYRAYLAQQEGKRVKRVADMVYNTNTGWHVCLALSGRGFSHCGGRWVITMTVILGVELA